MQQMTSSLPAPMLTSTERGWTGIELLRFKACVEEIALPPLPSHVVVVGLTHHTVDLVQRLDGKLYEGPCRQGDVSIVPVGTAVEVEFKERVESDVLNLHLGDAFLREVAQSVEVDSDDLEVMLRVVTPAPQIEQIGLSLTAELEADGIVGSKLYAESLANALAISLIRDHSSLGRKALRKATREHTGGLSKRALKSVTDYIGDNLANRDLTLAEIAGVAHMSPYHFSRLFKASTGLAPHQFVIERRVRRARELLGSTALPIAEIALLCGFAHQSHLNRHFKRIFGTSPKALR
ncbi:MAG: AraC family transcriptional regulator [Actinomycetota bacterium]|nr:AraC family transcriptional regulator [Actinomycetota bacterium]